MGESYSNDWFFPLLGGGEESGLNDPGVEGFKKGKSLGRETIQNIGDARSAQAIATNTPAVAEFELLDLPTSELPGSDSLRRIFTACRDHTRGKFSTTEAQEENSVPFFERGLEILGRDSIPTLRIRDRNTTGLLGSDDPSDRTKPWSRLVRAQGYASREGAGAGTYGIGQRAPFAFSELRTIIYYTHTEDGEAMVAKSILCSFPSPTDNEGLTQNKGWYCRKKKESVNWTGVRDPAEISAYYRREDIGTDLYVTGFRQTAKWQDEIRQSVLRNFFAAISSGTLEVKIRRGDDEQEIKSSNVLDLVRREAGIE